MNIPYNLARRICTIVDDEETIDKRLQKLSQILVKRVYPEKIIQIDLTNTLDLNQDEPRTYQRDQEKENCLTLVTIFNPNTPNMFPVIKTYLQMLMSSARMTSALSTIKIIHRRRRPPNLKQLLVKSKFTDKTEGIMSKGGENKCYTCKQLKTESSFYFKSYDQPFKVKQNMDCNSTFVIYVLTCVGCEENYIGETKTRLRERMIVHRQHVRDTKYTILPVSDTSHNVLSFFYSKYT